MSGQWSPDACWAPQEGNASLGIHSQFFPENPVRDLQLCQVCFIVLLGDTFLPPQNPVGFFSPSFTLSLFLSH